MSTTALLNKLKTHFVSASTGLVRSANVYYDEDYTLGLHIAGVNPSYFSVQPQLHHVDTCGGVSEEAEQALLSGLMEFAERYGGMCGGEENIHWQHPNMDNDIVGKHLPLFAPWQYQESEFLFEPISEDAPIRFIKGYSLTYEKNRQIPLAWVRIPFTPNEASEKLFCSTSNGMASGFNRTGAMISGILELCERDALMLMWYTKQPPNKLTLSVADLFGHEWHEKLNKNQLQCRFYTLTNDLGVPTAMCILRCAETKDFAFHYAIGAAARPCIYDACKKAFYEAVGERLRLRTLMNSVKYKNFKPGKDFENVVDFSEHSITYTLPEFLPEIDFIWSGSDKTIAPKSEKVMPKEPRALLRALVEIFKAKEYSLFAVPLDTAECRAVGVRVIKMVAPDLVPICADHRYPYLGSHRLYKALGFNFPPSKKDLLNVINLMPHPLA